MRLFNKFFNNENIESCASLLNKKKGLIAASALLMAFGMGLGSSESDVAQPSKVDKLKLRLLRGLNNLKRLLRRQRKKLLKSETVLSLEI